MTQRLARIVRNSAFVLGALTLSASVASSQQPPAPAAPAANAPAAPIERQPPSGPWHPGMRKGRMQRGPAQGKYRGASMKHKRGGPGGGFRGREGEGMGMGMHMGPPGMWWKNPMVVQKLALTADQTKRMDDIFQKSRLELIDLRAKLETQNALLEPLMSANPVDTAKAMAQIDKVAQARADLEKSDARMLLGIRGVLTPDQWTKLSAPRGPGEYGQPGGPGPGGPGGQAGAAPNAGPGGPGRGRGYRGGGPAQSASELVDPIDLP